MKQSVFCKTCEGRFLGLMNELLRQAKKSKRGQMIFDGYDDIAETMADGDIHRVQARDRAYQRGEKPGRKVRKEK